MSLTLVRRGVSRAADYGVKVGESPLGDVQCLMLTDSDGNVISFFGTSPASSVGDGSRTVTTAGTRVQLSASSVPCDEVEIVAKSTNTGNIWVGGASIAANSGRPLLPLQSLIAKVSNLNLIYLDADTNGEGVTYIYYS